MDLQSQKAIIIERFKQVEDENLIRAIKNLLDFAQKKESEVYEISEATQNLVMERFEKLKKNLKNFWSGMKQKKSLKPMKKFKVKIAPKALCNKQQS